MSAALGLQEIQSLLDATLVTEDIATDISVASACASDLMSDVLAFSKSESILLTGLTSPQAVRTAEVAEIVAICFGFGKTPPAETISLAHEIGLPLLSTKYSVFTASGLLYEAGLAGCHEIP